METINSMASSAAKVIWGENENNNTAVDKENQKLATDPTDTTTSTTDTTNNTNNNTNTMSAEVQGQEPISGKMGDTSKGEPFDAGNMETGSVQPEIGKAQPETASVQPETKTEDTVKSKGPTTEHPSTTGDSGFKAAQADVRDPETNPTTDPKKEAERKNVDDTGNLDASENPSKVDGPGPRPVEEVAREHGGDAAGGDAAKSNDVVGGAGAAPDSVGKEGEEVKGEENENKGSGEQWVKTSGLKADGGDFDATKPGAGREADRLMEEKGLSNPAAAAAVGGKTSEEAEPTDSPDSGKEKKTLKDKIKSKLHKN